MTEPSTSPHGPREQGSQRGEASPEASSPFVDPDTDAEQADAEGRSVPEDVEDNADLDG